MKAAPFEEKRLLKWKPPFIVQPKYDGWRCRAVPSNLDIGHYVLFSSEENIFFSVPHINEALDTLGLCAELDGELYCHKMPIEQLSSIVSRTVNLHPDHQQVHFHVFDIVNEEPQMKRLLQIENLKGLHPLIHISPFWLCESLEDIMRTYDRIIDLGYEGIIVRHFQAPYQRKRSTLVMKFKPKQEDIYEILSYEEEYSVSGVPKGSLGALVCDSGDGNTFNVGTGFSDEQRATLWTRRDELQGKFARVKYQHRMSGTNKPRFPVFVEVLERRPL